MIWLLIYETCYWNKDLLMGHIDFLLLGLLWMEMFGQRPWDMLVFQSLNQTDHCCWYLMMKWHNFTGHNFTHCLAVHSFIQVISIVPVQIRYRHSSWWCFIDILPNQNPLISRLVLNWKAFHDGLLSSRFHGDHSYLSWLTIWWPLN